MELCNLIADDVTTEKFNAERVRLEEALLDAANALTHHMGTAALKLNSRVDNGTMLVVGTRDTILQFAGLEVAGTVDQPCSPAWFARIECRPETDLAKGETLYRKRSHV